MNSLGLRYEPDSSDDVGRLWISVKTSNFAGRSFCWAYPSTVLEFANALNAYPITADALPGLFEGNGGLEGNDLVVGVQIKPADALGNLSVDVEIAGQLDRSHRLKTNFSTSYAELENFRGEIITMMRGGCDEAVLMGKA